MPDDMLPDTPGWKDRRRFAAEWFTMLQQQGKKLPFTEIICCAYPHVGTNNNDLPPTVTVVDRSSRGGSAPNAMGLADLLANSSVVIALTELSATAPLKLLAQEYGFRGATMPGFSRMMLPALQLDYEQIHSRVTTLKERMDRAEGAHLILSDGTSAYEVYFDLRYRSGHASGGLMRESGTVANLPSGEAYVVPYEGERAGETSKTAGRLPVQFNGETVVFSLEGNRAVKVLTSGRESNLQRAKLEQEPAYGNIAELGIGVLGEWGVKAVGSTLLDEKLGLHVAFGRSDHFGGITGAAAFSNPAQMVHIDWVYVKSVQPALSVVDLAFEYPDQSQETIMQNGKLTVQTAPSP
jgi:leucyl aminopeptidase (aminopeptidase T)